MRNSWQIKKNSKEILFNETLYYQSRLIDTESGVISDKLVDIAFNTVIFLSNISKDIFQNMTISRAS